MISKITNKLFAAENTFRIVENLLNLNINGYSLNSVGLTTLLVSATLIKVYAYKSYLTARYIKLIVI
jgi:hypothetical protein